MHSVASHPDLLVLKVAERWEFIGDRAAHDAFWAP
jgi:hypothetical protein